MVSITIQVLFNTCPMLCHVMEYGREEEKCYWGLDMCCVLFAPEPVFSIISTAKSVYCISYCKLFVSHSVKICRRENASPQSVVSSQQDKMVIKEDLAKSRVSRLRLN